MLPTTHCLYERILGDRFTQLDPVLQDFHRLGTAGSGQARVLRPQGSFRNLVARLMGLPPASAGAPLTLKVERVGNGEKWTRRFGTHELVTVQHEQRGMLIERAGMVRLAFEVKARPGIMSFRSRRGWFAGLPIPQLISPSATADVLPATGGWQVRVEVRLPLLGELVRYEGTVKPL